MKVKNLILLAFSLMFVAGGAAGCTTKEKQVDSKISIEQNKKEDYEENLAYLMKDVSEQSKVVSDILTGQKSVEIGNDAVVKASKKIDEANEMMKDIK
ncbi:hypothetical protein A6279_27980 [Bacillus wiedmannii]|uniref:hypothetical protein n=1 Tax=Bacillus wiedmannii TaxID=1890302 RepID=UPI0007DB05EA|nr:hypothetical protein [Bacillus wiedmannii]OAK05629.1 hypothetical protein A6279_27980 [Bacillus wiedmannii]